jgi:RecJ-like exonuclease
MLINSGNNIGMYIHIICAHAKFHEKLTFLWHVQEDKKSREKLILALSFYFFYIGHSKSRFLLKRLLEHVRCEDIHATLVFKIFNICMCYQCISMK